MSTLLTSHITERDTERDKLAAQMAAFERANGPVETLPIFTGERPKQLFQLVIPGKPKPVHPVAVKERRPSSATALRQERAKEIRKLCAQGKTFREMAEQMGLTVKYVQRIVYERGFECVSRVNKVRGL